MKISNDNKNYFIYIAKYIGVALVAGSVVHIGTLQNGFTRYIVLAIIGLILMMIGNMLEAKKDGQKINFNFLFIIVGLSFSTGFLSGGAQHYLDNPIYAGWLLAIGIFVSYITYFWKDKLMLNSKNILVVLLVSILILLFSNFIVKDLVFKQKVNVDNLTETQTLPTHKH